MINLAIVVPCMYVMPLLKWGIHFNLVDTEPEGEPEADSTPTAEQESDLSQHSEKESPDEVCTCVYMVCS